MPRAQGYRQSVREPEGTKRKFLPRPAVEDRLAASSDTIQEGEPAGKMPIPARIPVPIRVTANYRGSDGDPLSVNSDDDDLKLNSSNRDANSNSGVGASLGTSREADWTPPLFGDASPFSYS